MTTPTPAQPVRFLSPEEISSRGATEIPHLRLGAADTFRQRAVRLRELSAGHPMGDYLRFAAQIAEAQDALAGADWPVTPPDAAQIDQARERAMPPLHVAHWRPGAGLRTVARGIARHMTAHAQLLPPPVLTTLAALRDADDSWIDTQADKLVNGITVGLDVAAAPLIGAAAQVLWMKTAAALGPGAFVRLDAEVVCPVCGSRPTASVLRIGGDVGGHRYLHCSLCESEWHMVRIKCSNCEGTEKVRYQQLEAIEDAAPRQEAIRAETCDDCGTYLKLLHQDRDPRIEPVADDLASVALDLLVAESGYLRSGQNLLLIHGEAE